MFGIKPEYFIFSKKEKKGIGVLGILLTISLIWTWCLSPSKNSQVLPSTFQKYGHEKKERFKLPTSFFIFDPNTMDSQAALLLGMTPKQIKTLLKYRNRGGRFYKKEDIFKLYGIDSLLANAMLPFIKIAASVKREKFWKIDLNEMNVKEWRQTSLLTEMQIQNIQKYHISKGSFYSIYELQKVYGISDTLFQILKPHLWVSKNGKQILNSRTMNFNQWKSLGLFSDKQIFQILAIRKQQKGEIGWKKLVVLFDLTQDQAKMIISKIIIND